MSDRVLISLSDGVADVRFNRADKRNALDNAMFQAIAEAGEQLKSEPGLRAVVLSGDGPSFCAGLDFSSFQAMAGGGDEAPAERPARAEGNPGEMKDGRITHLGQQVCWVWQELPVPVIAAVHGPAFGGGFQLMLPADLRLIAPDAILSVAEVRWGLIPDMAGTQLLPRLVGMDMAKELTFTARVFSGTEAYELGLATRLSDNPYDDAMALAVDIAGRSPGAVRGSKALFNRLTTPGAAEQFAAERSVIGAQIGSANQIEAVKAGFENRSPVFADLD